MVSATSGGTFTGAVTFNGSLTSVNGTFTGDVSVADDLTVSDDLLLASDGAIVKFGADADVTLTHVHDTGLSLNTNLTITRADNDTQLTLISTDADANVAPTIDMTRDSSSPADDDFIGRIRFRGENDASEVINYAAINAVIKDVTDGTEDGRLDLRTFKAGTERSRILIDKNETVFNDDSENIGTRFESDNDENALFVAGDTGKIGVGTGAPAHDLEIKRAAPEIMLEETSSGGSKRLSLGVESDGTPFISAEQSGGQVEVQLAGNPEFQFLNGGRFRVTRTGVPAYISRGPVTGVTVDAGSTTSVAGLSGVLHNIVMVSTGGGYGATFAMSYHSTVTKLVGTGNFSASSGTSSSSNVYKSSASHAVTLQNNTSSAISYYILILSSYD